MEIKTARHIGGGLATQTLLYTVLVLELWHLREETRGDFDNGILFYLAEELNPVVILGYAILFSGTYFLGRLAGKEILIDGRRFVWVGLKFSFAMLAPFSVFLLIVFAANHAPGYGWQVLLFEVLKFAVLLVVTWIWAGWRINRKH